MQSAESRSSGLLRFSQCPQPRLLNVLALYNLTFRAPVLFVRLLNHPIERGLGGLTEQGCLEAGAKPAALSYLLDPKSHYKCERLAEKTLQWIESRERGILGLEDDDYPALLREIASPPPLLFFEGQLTAFSLPCFSIVGSRRPSRSAEITANELAGQLAIMGFGIVSGLARGVDSLAHTAAIEAGGTTIAILGTGMNRIYPQGQTKLRARIPEHGLVLSEFPLNTDAFKEHFPRRNRVVTGLSMGTLIVEAGLRSGSMISARLAMEQGREVFAVPGNIHNPQSKGCHQLIRDGAVLTECIEDILRELPPGKGAPNMTEISEAPVLAGQGLSANRPPLAESERRLLANIDMDPVSIDVLVNRTGLDVSQISSLLTQLELLGLVHADISGYSLEPGGKLR